MATGPVTKTKKLPVTGEAYYYRYQEVYKTPRPHIEVAPYSAVTIRRTSGVGRSAAANFDSNWTPYWLQASTADPYLSWHQSYQTNARNRAVARFNSRKGEQAAAAVALAEVTSTGTMLTKRITQVAKAASALRKFRFRDAANALGLVKDKRPRKVRLKGTKLRWTKHPIDGKYFPSRHVTSKERRSAHAFSSIWLEWSFGWAPLVQDISTAAKVLSEPLLYETLVKGSGGYESGYVRTQLVTANPSYNVEYKNTVLCRQSCRVQAILTAKNPNKDLARRIGLADLTGAALEVVPFSFVANWFINLNEFASQFTSTYGLEVKSPFYTDYVVSSNVQVTRTIGKVVGYQNTTTPGACFTAVSVKRYVGSLPSVKLGIRPAYHLSFRRAITQSALLVTLFTGKR